MVKTKDLRAMTIDELEAKLLENKKEQFNLRIQQSTGQLANTTVKVVCLCTHYVLTLIMQPQRLIQLMVLVALKFGFIRAKLWLMIQWHKTRNWLNKSKNEVLIC